ncbi:catalase [Bacillus stercoris]|nr:catalase [Bacillus stercoris]
MRTVGNRGPTTLENYDFLEKISHFDRERIPERVVHAREQVHTGILKRTEASETNRFQHIPGPSSFRKKARKHRHLSVFQL